MLFPYIFCLIVVYVAGCRPGIWSILMVSHDKSKDKPDNNDDNKPNCTRKPWVVMFNMITKPMMTIVSNSNMIYQKHSIYISMVRTTWWVSPRIPWARHFATTLAWRQPKCWTWRQILGCLLFWWLVALVVLMGFQWDFNGSLHNGILMVNFTNNEIYPVINDLNGYPLVN